MTSDFCHCISESMAQAEDKLATEASRYEHVIKRLEQELDETKAKLNNDVYAQQLRFALSMC